MVAASGTPFSLGEKVAGDSAPDEGFAPKGALLRPGLPVGPDTQIDLGPTLRWRAPCGATLIRPRHSPSKDGRLSTPYGASPFSPREKGAPAVQHV
jgi:hypothetical protein